MPSWFLVLILWMFVTTILIVVSAWREELAG